MSFCNVYSGISGSLASFLIPAEKVAGSLPLGRWGPLVSLRRAVWEVPVSTPAIREKALHSGGLTPFQATPGQA